MSNSTLLYDHGSMLTRLSVLPITPLSTLVLVPVVLVGLLVSAVVLNAAHQLLIPQDPSLPPLVFHWIPIVGSAVSYGTDPINFFLKCREKHGDIFTFILLGRRMTVALGPRGNNFILASSLAQTSASEAYKHLVTPVFGEGVVYDVPNHVFMEQKRFIKSGLSVDNLRAYIPQIEAEVELMLAKESAFEQYRSEDKSHWGSFHCFKRMAELTIFTASRTLQGRDVRDSLDKTFAQRYHDLDNGFTPINFLFPNLPLPSYRRRDKAQKDMSDFFVNIMREREASQHEQMDDENDMLAALSQVHYKDGRPLSERETAHIMIGLLMAGQHTSSATSSWVLLHLAQRPDVQEALYREQVEHFGLGNAGEFRDMTFDELRSLPILDSIIRETLRMHPPIHSIIRKVMSDMSVPATLGAPSEGKTYVVPKGHYLLATPAVSQMDPRVWKNVDTWDPDRWSDPSGVAQLAYKEEQSTDKVDYGFGAVSKGTESPYQPFGAGRHRCVGEQFAYVQLGTIVATMVRKMELKLEGPFPEHNYSTMITLPKDPCTIQYRRR